MDNLISLSEIVAELQERCADKQTGRFVVLSDANVFFSFDIDEGQVVKISCGPKQGMQAVNEIVAKIASGKPVFMSNVTPVHAQDDIPPLDEIVATLTSSGTSRARRIAAVEEQAVASLSDDQKTLLLDALAKAIGPISKVVGPSVLANVSDFDSAVKELLAEIPDSAQATKFLADVKHEQ